MKEPVDQHSGPVDAGSDGRKASRTGGVAVGDRRDSHPGARAVGPAGGGPSAGFAPATDPLAELEPILAAVAQRDHVEGCRRQLQRLRRGVGGNGAHPRPSN